MKHSFEGRGPRAVYGLLVLQSLTASGTHLVAKVVVQAVDAFTLTLIRSVVAAGGMALVLLLRGRMPKVRREDWRLVVALSVLAVPVNQFLFLFGMKYTTPGNAALLYATTPILVLLFSRWFLGERLTTRKILGVALAVGGVTVVVFERGLDASMQYVFGNLIMSVAVTAWGLYTVFGKTLIAKYGPIDASAITLFVGTLLFLPIGILPAFQFPYASMSAANWVEVGYLGIVTSVVAYLLWYAALSRIEASKVALFTNLQPILTSILALLLLGQGITLTFVVGGSITICGVALAQHG
jgi:RarD protein